MEGKMGQQLYFDNYSPVGDIVVVAISFVMVILLATSHVTRTRNFKLFLNMILYLALAGLSNLVLHDFYAHITNGDYTAIYILRVVYHGFLFSLFLLYTVYFVEVLHLKKKWRIPIMTFASAVYLAVMSTDIVTTIRGTGFRLNGNGTAVSGVNIFMLGYLVYVVIIIYLVIVFRNRIYKKAVFGILGTMAVAFAILFNQGRHGQSSYTVVTFLLPLLAIMYLLHSNPYNIDLGSVSAMALGDTVKYLASKKRDFVFVSLYLPGFDSGEKQLPKKLQASIRQYSAEFFKRSVLFRISGAQMLLLAETRANPNIEEKFQTILKQFQREYEIYGLDYKVILGRSIDEISQKNDYLSLIWSIHRHMELNTIHKMVPEDIFAFKKSVDILKELEDIVKNHDLDDPRVLTYCQPVYNIKNGRYDTAEALMRLELPEYGMVFPDQFIPLAEEHGFIHILTEIILHKTCKAVKELLAEGYEVRRISVNVSVPEFRNENFTKDIEDIIKNSGIPDGKVAIEITESQSDSDFLNINRILDELKDCGMKFYLDDFGTGFSNMERILKLPFDIIKFDRSMVMAGRTDKRSEEIVRRLAGMFSDLEYSVLYEGIEDEEDEKRCIEMSASYLQGYKYSKPIPIGDLRKFFSKTES